MEKNGIAADVEWERIQPYIGPYDEIICSTLGIGVLILFTFMGTVTNVFSFRYFFTKPNAFYRVFRVAALCDAAICILSSLYGLSLLTQRSELLFGNEVFCTLSALLWTLCVRFSICLAALLSFMRVMTICFPLRSVPGRPMIIVPTMLVVFITVLGLRFLEVKPDFTHRFHFRYTKMIVSCIPTAIESQGRSIVLQLFTFGPLLLIMLSCIVGCCTLFRQMRVLQRRLRTRQSDRKRMHSFISILVFGAACVTFHTPSYALKVLQLLMTPFPSGQHAQYSKQQVWLMIYGQLIFRRILLSLNSFANPVIYFWRMRHMREYVHWSVVSPVRRFMKKYFQSDETAAAAGEQPGQHHGLPATNRTARKLKFTATKMRGNWAVSRERNVSKTAPFDIELDIRREDVRNVSGREIDSEDRLCQCECCYLEDNNVSHRICDPESGIVIFANRGAVTYEPFHAEAV